MICSASNRKELLDFDAVFTLYADKTDVALMDGMYDELGRVCSGNGFDA